MFSLIRRLISKRKNGVLRSTVELLLTLLWDSEHVSTMLMSEHRKQATDIQFRDVRCWESPAVTNFLSGDRRIDLFA
jgi:hypothetical protein